MRYLFPTALVILTALSAGIQAKPTGTTPNPATNVLKARETLAGTKPYSTVTITTFNDSGCTEGGVITDMVYERPINAHSLSFKLSRDLVEGEQLDVSGGSASTSCQPYIGAAVASVSGAAATLVPSLGSRWNPATGNVCYVVGPQAAGCFKLWNRN